MEVAQQLEISDCVISTGQDSVDMSTVPSSDSTGVAAENYYRPGSLNDLLPFARYSVCTDPNSSGSYQSRLDDGNVIHCQFQGIKCLNENRKALQLQSGTDYIYI